MQSNKNILVTGGAGYIGSHTVKQLIEKGYEVTVYDNLSYGWRDFVDSDKLIEGDLSDKDKIEKLFEKKNFSSVIHFAAFIAVEESVEKPLKYYENNTVNLINLILLCQKYDVKNFIFSSTAGIYGDSGSGLINESCSPSPQNPYAFSKYLSECSVKSISEQFGINYIIFRYFNVAGASSCGTLGQKCEKATHLIKIACELATGKRDSMKIYGKDYNTNDGTCVRDYIHVEDLAEAHVLGLKYLENGGKSDLFNIGYGNGYSVLEVINKLEQILEKKLNWEYASRRTGDVASLVADNSKIVKAFNWKPKYNDLEYIIKSALEWEKKL